MAQNNKRNYTQPFTYDKIGNMLTKVSTESKYPNVSVSALNYTNAYSYYTDAPHRAEIIGDMYYKYDNNGNVIEERQGGHREETVGGTFSYTYPDTDITRTSQAFGWDRGGETEPDSTYRREYTWDEENRLTGTSDPSYTTVYTYDHEGERTVKYSDLGETLYFDSMWLEADTEGTGRLRCTKNIYIGETRIASKLNYKGEGTDYEDIHTYYYHTDHLSSSNLVTDADGEVYEHMEYTPKDAWESSKLACDQPYGEKWILDQNDNSKYDMIPYRFTAKERDEETGLYYMSARYQNPETSRWVSSDTKAFQLISPMEKSKDGKFNQRSGFKIIESVNPYSYTSNNPVRYIDPTGEDSITFSTRSEGQQYARRHNIVNWSSWCEPSRPVFKPPVAGYNESMISSPFGKSRDMNNNGTYVKHTGLDIAVVEGTDVLASLSGKVSKIGLADDEYGNYMIIDSGKGYSTMYAHLLDDSISLEEGATVKTGEKIGLSGGKTGNTGTSTGPHLHFEIRKDDVAIDPQPLIKPEDN